MASPIQKKLSIKTVNPVKRSMIPAVNGEVRWLVRCVARVVGYKTGESDFGGWTALLGMHKWTNLDSGEEFRSSKAFFPDVITDPIIGQIAGQDQPLVEFIVKIGIRAMESSPVGYEYVAEEVLPVTGGGDPLAALEQKAAQLLLPAPEKTDSVPAPQASRAASTHVKSNRKR
jgi:hypothetical protein